MPFYAVRQGRVPGIYNTFKDAKAQVSGFSNGIYRKFSIREDAEAFMRTRSNSKSKNIKESNAVLNMNPRWSSSPSPRTIISRKRPRVSRATGWSGLRTRRRANLTDAELMEETVHEQKVKQDRKKSSIVYKTHNLNVVNVTPFPRLYPKAKSTFTPTRGWIYTDGSCIYNGTSYARAGYGVYFWSGCPFNISERLKGHDQQSGRAEIMAVLAALRITANPPLVQSVDALGNPADFHEIHQASQMRDAFIAAYRNPTIATDSKYVIDVVSSMRDHASLWSMNARPLARRLKHLDLFIEIAAEAFDRKITWTYVSAHSNNGGNEAADALAKGGCKEQNIDIPII